MHSEAPPSTEPAPAATHEPATAPVASPPRSPLRWIVRLTVLALLLVFIYHLVADRFTPYTTQANVDSFVVEIAPQVSGPVVAVVITDNQSVSAGQVLFQVDPLPFEIAVQAARANQAVAQQGVDASAAEVRVAAAQLQRQRAELASSEQLGRIVLGLAAKRALSETTAIRARSDIARSRADIQRALAEAERARIRMGNGADAPPQLLQAMASVEQATLDLRNTTITAPAAGAVTHLRLAPGQFVSRGQPVMGFIADGPRWVTAAMRENQLGRISAGDRAYVTFDNRPGDVFAARVDSVGRGVAQGGESPSGQLPSVAAPTGWLREPQRFPVRLVLEPGTGPDGVALAPGRSGAQASVVVLTGERSLLHPVAYAWIWLAAQLSYLQ